jgi:hypothetical protein
MGKEKLIIMAFVDPRKVVALELAGAHLTARSSNVSAQTCINWYPEVFKNAEKTKVTLYPTPGTTFIKNVGLGPHRASIVHKGLAYYVSGNELIKQDTNETFTSLGTISTTTGPVSMASNGAFGDQIIIVDGTDGYIWDTQALTLTVIADAQFPTAPSKVVYMDSYFIVTSVDSGQFNISTSNDGSAWDALDFANAERAPDNTVAMETLNRDIYFVGDYTTEVWTNTGGRFPFEPYSNGVIEFGTSAAGSLAKTDEGIVFVTRNQRGQGKIVGMKGTNSMVLSNPALEYQISTYGDISDAYAFTYEQAGHIFYQITFPSSEKTWVFDVTLGDVELGWHQRSTNDLRHVASTHIFYNNKNYVGDYNSPSVYSLDLDMYTDNGMVIKRERAGIHMQSNRNRIRYDRLELEFEAGIGLISGQGSDPKVMVDWSDDGGHTWSETRYLSVGAIGQYSYRALLHHLGSSRDRIFRVRTSDPVKWVLIGAYVYIEELLH